MGNKRKSRRPRPAAPDTGIDEHRLEQRLAAARDALERIRRGEAPTAEELAAAPRLDSRWVVSEQHYFVLQGIVTGHPGLAEGALIGTSPLLWLAADRSAARTVSRFYRLGPPLAEIASRRH
jgi:hypothetical protein